MEDITKGWKERFRDEFVGGKSPKGLDAIWIAPERLEDFISSLQESTESRVREDERRVIREKIEGTIREWEAAGDDVSLVNMIFALLPKETNT